MGLLRALRPAILCIVTLADVAALQAQNALQQEAIRALSAQVATLTEQLAASQREAAAQRDLARKGQRQVERLVAQLNDLTAMLRRFLHDRPPPPPAVDDDDGEDDDPGPPASTPAAGEAGAPAPPVPGPPGAATGRGPKAPGRGARKGPGARLATDVVQPAVPARCPCCQGARLLARDWEVTHKYTAVSGFVRRLELRREVRVCADCNERVSAPVPPMPWKNCQFTPELLALVVYMKFALGVPLDRLWKALRRQGVDIPWPSMPYLVERADRLFATVDHEHFRQLKAGPVIGVDGTGLDVVVPGLGRVWHGYIDVFCRDHLHVYQYSHTKHADLLKEKLGSYAGTIVCDAESRNDLLVGEGVTEANCNAHPRRKFKDAEASQPVLAREARAFVDRLYAVEDLARERGASGATLLALRQARARPVADDFRRWIAVTLPTLLPSDPLRKALRYYDRHFEALTRYIDDASVPIDNNRSERAFQAHAKLRVAAEFAGSVEGAHRWATLLGVVNTAKRLGVDVLAYLTWAIERLGTHRRQFGLAASELTPEAYQRAMAAAEAA